MATRAVARRQSATGETARAASSVRAHGGEIADRDLVGMYLDEIARTPLLDAAKEVELSQIIEAGVFARQVLDGFEETKADATREELEALIDDERAGQGRLHPLQPPPGRRRRPPLPPQRSAAAGPDPGGQRRPGARGREVRLPQGLQVLHVRDVVDPPGHHPLDSRPVPYDPPARPPRGGARPDPPRAARVQPRARPGPGARGDRGRARLDARSASPTCSTGPATRSR